MKERLYRLLPSIYRQSDQNQGYALRALMNALESEFQILEADMDGLYDNWFIETAQEWVVPYIGELLGVYDFSQQKNLFFSQRRRVANTIGYRRRKGLPAILEHVTQDVTGWPSHVVEYMQLLATTQHLSHVRPGKGALIDVRQARALEQLDGPFDTSAHTADVRHIGTSSTPGVQNYKPQLIAGKYRGESLGLFMWRLQSYQMVNVPAAYISRSSATRQQLPPGCFTFDPLRHDIQLFSLSQEVSTINQRTGIRNVPEPISRIALANDLKEYAARPPEKQTGNSTYYGPGSSLYIVLKGKPVPPNVVISADLSEWQLPQRTGQGGEPLVAVDPALGHLVAFDLPHAEKIKPGDVEVTYCYGFSSGIGGGSYIRQLPPTEPYIITVKRGYDTVIDIEHGSTTSTLRTALNLWEQYCQTTDKPRCTIRILDNGNYTDRSLTLLLPENSRLVLEAAHSLRPTVSLAGNLTIRSGGENAQLMLNGLAIGSKLSLQGDMQLAIAHCTLMPYGIETHRTMPRSTMLQITIDHSIVGPLRLSEGRGTLHIEDSIVDGRLAPAINTLTTEHMGGIVSHLERVTIFGRVQLHELELAREVIFTAPVFVQRRHRGQVRFSYIPATSHIPRHDHCLIGRWQQDAQGDERALGEDEASSMNQQIYPLFTSSRYGDPGYAQLSMQCAPQIRRGGEDGSEMGVFHSLRNIQRQDNLYHILDEYFPYAMLVNIFYET